MWQISSHVIIKQMHNSSRIDPPYRNTRQKQHTITNIWRISFDHNFPEPREGVKRRCKETNFNRRSNTTSTCFVSKLISFSLALRPVFSESVGLVSCPNSLERLIWNGQLLPLDPYSQQWLLLIFSFSSMHVTFDNATFSWLFQRYYVIVPTVKRSFPTENTQNGSKERPF